MGNLQAALDEQGHKLLLVLGYGDSADGTGGVLFEECVHRFSARLVDVSHGGAVYGSIVHAQRFRQLAHVGNALWKNIPFDSDIVGLVESDLIWHSETLKELISEVHSGQIVAPMVMHLNGLFYDRFAFVRNGINFKNERPFHPDLRPGIRYYDMESIGSVFFADAGVVRGLSWPEEDVVVGFCKQARERGATIVLDSYLKVTHP
jgi:hypothetical protein